MNLYVYVIGCCVFIGTVVGWGEARYRMGRHDGYAAAEDDRKTARAEARRGRHARTQPRTSLVGSPPALPSEMTPPRPMPRLREGKPGKPGRVMIPGRSYAEWMAANQRRTVTTAADIAPVVLPEPGSYLPGPLRSTAPGTVTFPKVQLDTATTGEIRAIGDEMVAAIKAAGEAS